MFKKLLGGDKGFTLIEMMVVLIIIAVLIAGGIRFYAGYIENSRVTKARVQLSTIQAALDSYYAEKGNYPYGEGLANQLLSAGLVVDASGALVMEDPWGKPYEYAGRDEGSGYLIKTGESDVQGATGAVVFGKGKDGVSEPPSVGEPG